MTIKTSASTKTATAAYIWPIFCDVIIDGVPNMTEGSKMKVRWAADGWDMLINVQVGVKSDSQKLEVVGKGNLRTSDVYTGYIAKRRVMLRSAKDGIWFFGI